MSKINAVRFINLNYNNNSIRISDETFHLNGEGTFLSLRNGGGKSVLVQMMQAPFVHKRYQDAKDRPFSSYFTTNRPSFIMVEWKLDQGAGYVLTGMMVRKNQEISEEAQEELEIVNFISEYKERCQQDIHHLPVVEKTRKEVVLKGFQACRQLFESYKKERGVAFFYFDMNNPAQSRQYFDKLKEYQIHYKEWETIIRKVNLKESGLSDLFADCKDEKGLVEKWFLEAVEDKLNKDKNRMKEFQSIVEKYTGQYKDNKSKIERRDTIQAFARDAEQIHGCAVHYQEVSAQLSSQKAHIGHFLRTLGRLHDREEHNAQEALQKKMGLEERLSLLEYEKISGEIHGITDRERHCGRNLEMLLIEKEDLERGRESISHRLRLLDCARKQEGVTEYGQERDREYKRLQLCLEAGKDLEPERKRLGEGLKKYFGNLKQEKEREREEWGARLLNLEEKKNQEQEALEGLRETYGRLSEQAGALGAVVRAFDSAEDTFNREYGESFCRNILGEYEPGAMQICRAEYEKQLGQTEHDRTDAKREAEQLKGKRKALQRLLEDRNADKIRLESDKREAQRLLLEYEEELKERQVILRYFGLEEDLLFDTPEIIGAADRRLTDTDLVRRRLEQEAAALEKENRRMAQGQVLELPEEFSVMLEEAGIHYVYGMEWLRRNQYSPAQNRELLEEHPFLPYSLILSAQEFGRLRSLPEPVYTSFPVPIMVREELERTDEPKSGAVCSFGKVSFYVWFNKNLLEEEKLRRILEERAARLEKLLSSVNQKETEYREYFEKKEKIRNQKVTRPGYDAVTEGIRRQEQELAALERELLGKREELEELESGQAQLEQRMTRLEQELQYRQRRLGDFGGFVQAYEEYRENSRLLVKNRKERERILEQQKLKSGIIGKLEQDIATGRNRLIVLERKAEEYGGKLTHFGQYSVPEDAPGFTDAQAMEAENRYEVITSGISAERKDLEERVETAEGRYAKALEELENLRIKYRFAQGAWSGICYDRREESHQEGLLESQDKKLEVKKGLIHDQEIQCALLRQERENKYKELKERCGKEEPVAKADIQTIDFTEAIRRLEYEKREIEEEERRIQKKIQGYESNLAALAEYEEFAGMEPVEWEYDLSAMSGQELARQKGLLVRDYNSLLEQRRDARAQLERVLNQIIRKERFAEDFYRKPLEAMLLLAEDAEHVLRQLDTTLASYHNLMEKLMVDISLVEKEKEKIVELMGDYLREVHENLSKIDGNSTISIRERPVKMLKIQLPDWAENESFYDLRLSDYIDDITKRGIALLEENKNVQEYLGTKVTTKGLYDAVVGIGNVQIRLYKVEAQREYPITWAEVAKNSGGEGFLSAFVILSSLLYYMRRDDSDIFADRNEGKVLVMDNPFAQTNAAHLLKPLMDMAKKTNTQLICLSGLGGEAIYNCFDNIYVLTLIAASLRSDMQYLRAEHMRGSEEETMITSRIEVMEQMELVF